jgi:hypothetical protein
MKKPSNYDSFFSIVNYKILMVIKYLNFKYKCNFKFEKHMF